MFTGLVEEIGIVKSLKSLGGGTEVSIQAVRVMNDIHIDNSISVQGVCLTVVAFDQSSFTVQAIEETLKKTTMGLLQDGSCVNLERALLPTTRMGGHFVQGHVDCVGTVISVQELSTSHEIWIGYDAKFSKLVVTTGSICVNGISLTVARCEAQKCMVAIIPHTWNETAISELQSGSQVNLEFDILGKYVVNAMELRAA